MTRLRWLLIIGICLLVGLASMASAVSLSVVEVQDQYTGARGLTTFLRDHQIEYTDITSFALEGKPLPADTKVLLLGSFITSNAQVREWLASQHRQIDSFVKNGGVLVQLTQTDQEEPLLAWLPGKLAARRGDVDLTTCLLVQPDHLLLTTPNRITTEELTGWKFKTWSTFWEVLEEQSGFNIIVAQDKWLRHPLICEGQHGLGRVLLVGAALDKYTEVGETEATKIGAARLLENVLVWVQTAATGGLPAVVPTAPYQPELFPVTVSVFVDANADGIRQPEEAPLAGAQVSDGHSIVVTKADGTATLQVPLEIAPWITYTVPAGYRPTTPWYFLTGMDPESLPPSYEFGVAAAPERAGKEIVFAQITDLHLGLPYPVAEEGAHFAAALAEVAKARPRPDFVVATGDLVNSGAELDQWQAYQEGLATFRLPCFHNLGNHDYNGAFAAGAVDQFMSRLAPPHYAWDWGGWHFISIDSCSDTYGQSAWLAADLKLNKKKPTIVFQHYPPNRALLAQLEKYPVKAIFTGHWHSDKVFEDKKGLVSYNTPTLRFGGIDTSPRGFRLMTLKPDGTLSGRYVECACKPWASVLWPQEGAVISGAVKLLASASGGSASLKRSEWRLWRGEELLARGALVSQNALTYAAEPRSELFTPGAYRLEVTFEWTSGEVSVASSEFIWSNQARLTPAPRHSWPQLRGDAERTGVAAKRGSAFPAELAWVTVLPGRSGLASPVYAAGVLVVSQDEAQDGSFAGLVALSPTSGQELWRFQTASAVKGSPAIVGNTVCAVTVTGEVYGLDLATGAPKWDFLLGDPADRYVYQAPLALEESFVVGSGPRLVNLRAKDGKLLWERTGLAGDWISSYSSPAYGDGRVFASFNWGLELAGLDARTGEVLWTCREGSGGHASPVFFEQTVYMAGVDKGLRLIDPLTGKVRQTIALKGAGWLLAAPLVTRWRLYQPGPEGELICFDREKGQELWRFQTGPALLDFSPYQPGGAAIASSPILVGDAVVFGGGDGKLYALDYQTGNLLWSADLGAPVTGTAMATGDLLSVTTYAGVVFGFRLSQ